MRRPGSGLIALGSILLAGALSLTAYNLWDGYRADAAAQEIVVQLQQIVPGTPEPQVTQAPALEAAASETAAESTDPVEEASLPTEAPEDVFADIVEREMPTMELGGYTYIGILDIPSLELSLPVMDTWDYTRLKVSPCRFYGTTYQNNLVICAHNYAHHFSPVKTLPMGTELAFTDADGIVTHYRICDIEIIGPNDVESMTTGDWDLTLFTCTTGGQTRAAVRCALFET